MHSKDLDGRRGVVIDTMVFIYLFEDHPAFGDICENLFNQIKVGVFSAIVTPITAAEVLVKPLKKGQMSIADKYRNAIRNMPNISNIKFDVEIGFMAGSLRAKYGLPLPDMLQVAAALASTGKCNYYKRSRHSTRSRNQCVLIERFGDLITDCE